MFGRTPMYLLLCATVIQLAQSAPTKTQQTQALSPRTKARMELASITIPPKSTKLLYEKLPDDSLHCKFCNKDRPLHQPNCNCLLRPDPDKTNIVPASSSSGSKRMNYDRRGKNYDLKRQYW